MREQSVVESLVECTRAVLDAVRSQLPGARIVLQTLLPAGENERNEQVARPPVATCFVQARKCWKP